MRTVALISVSVAAVLALGAGRASALEIRSLPAPGSGDGQLVIGGVTGRGLSDPAARRCYGSTLCRESGTYYSEQGVLHYENGQPLVPVERPSGIKPAGETE